MTMRFTLTVESVDGSQRQVIADQRDAVRFEREERISSGTAIEQMPNAFGWCLAFYALQRTGEVDAKVTRDKWEATVTEVQWMVDSVDPTQPAAPTPSPPPSQSKPVSRSRKS